MDDPSVDVHELGVALQFLERVNMLPGASDLAAEGALALLEPGPATLLDIGAGGGDVALDVTRRLDRAGVQASVIGLDLHARTLAYARGRNGTRLPLIRGDATALPLASGSVDVAYSTNFLHHLDDAQAIACLAEMNRVARRGVVVVDLERSSVTFAGVWLITRVANRVAAHDGPVSVRRSFTCRELEAAAAAAGLARPSVGRHVPFRLMLVSAKSG